MNIPAPLKAVYSYYFPKIRNIISQTVKEYPHEIFLQSIEPGLDDFHFITIEKYIKYFNKELNWIQDYSNQYFTNWSSEWIFHLLCYIKTIDSNCKIYVFEWEYEWYRWYGENLNLKFETISRQQDLSKLELGYFFISNPSARDWNIIPNNEINEIADLWHKIIIDLTYLWLTPSYKFNLKHPNIIAVICSMSKPFGLYYYRIWFMFSKFEIKTLLPNKWFKNILSLIIANKILDKIKPFELYEENLILQENSLLLFEKKYWIKPMKSNVLLLGYLNSYQVDKTFQDQFNIYKRWSNYRFCLTPYFQLLEKDL